MFVLCQTKKKNLIKLLVITPACSTTYEYNVQRNETRKATQRLFTATYINDRNLQ